MKKNVIRYNEWKNMGYRTQLEFLRKMEKKTLIKFMYSYNDQTKKISEWGITKLNFQLLNDS